MQIKRTENLSYLINDHIYGRSTLVFLHGFPDNFYVWKELSPYLEEKYNLICISAPGCSEESTSISIKEFRLKNLSEKYLEIIRESEIDTEKIILIAHDIAGPYAHHMLDFLDDDTRLICINTLSGHAMINRKSNPEQILRSSYMTLFQLPLVAKKTLFKYWYFLRENAHLLGRSDKKMIPSEYDSHILNGLFFYKALLLDTPKFFKKKKWKNDTLFIWSNQDPFLVKPTEKELSVYYEKLMFKPINAGHWPMLDEPKEMALIIDNFLREEDRP